MTPPPNKKFFQDKNHSNTFKRSSKLQQPMVSRDGRAAIGRGGAGRLSYHRVGGHHHAEGGFRTHININSNMALALTSVSRAILYR